MRFNEVKRAVNGGVAQRRDAVSAAIRATPNYLISFQWTKLSCDVEIEKSMSFRRVNEWGTPITRCQLRTATQEINATELGGRRSAPKSLANGAEASLDHTKVDIFSILGLTSTLYAGCQCNSSKINVLFFLKKMRWRHATWYVYTVSVECSMTTAQFTAIYTI